ncbi:hypothetical protein C8Q75DRAFT_866447 [Abortiporus biennis]|nr:hypothetical protein C8Q75DRAFT_866447 [Abortiporus biennis]
MQWKVEVSRRMDEFLVVAFHVLSLFSESSNPSFEITEDRQCTRVLLRGYTDNPSRSIGSYEDIFNISTKLTAWFDSNSIQSQGPASRPLITFSWSLECVRVLGKLAGWDIMMVYFLGTNHPRTTTLFLQIEGWTHLMSPDRRRYQVTSHFQSSLPCLDEFILTSAYCCSAQLIDLPTAQFYSHIDNIPVILDVDGCLRYRVMTVCFVLYSPPARIKDVETFSLPSANRQFPFDTASSTLWTWIYWCMGRLL